jgi:DHA1 family tetracycline resistance protein-like MFS transporter
MLHRTVNDPGGSGARRHVKDRRLLVIFGIVLVDMLSFSLVLPLLPYYARTFGANPALTGLIFSAYPLAQVFAAPLLGRLSDRYGRKPVLMLSITGTVGALLLLGFSSTLWMLALSRLLDGITGGNISVAQAYMTDVTSEKDRGKAFGLIGAAFGIGFILGPAMSGLLSGFGMHVPPFAAAGLACLNLLFVAVVLPESLTAERRAEVAAAPPHRFDLHGLGAALRLPRVGPLLWVRLVTGFSFAVFEGGFTLWAAHALGLGPTGNAYVLTYVGVIQVVIQGAVIGPLTKRFADSRLIVASTARAGVSRGVGLLAEPVGARGGDAVPVARPGHHQHDPGQRSHQGGAPRGGRRHRRTVHVDRFADAHPRAVHRRTSAAGREQLGPRSARRSAHRGDGALRVLTADQTTGRRGR